MARRKRMTHKRRAEIYWNGIPGKKWGIWNNMRKEFQFGICEDTPHKAEEALFQKIGYDSCKVRFEPKVLPDETSAKEKTRKEREHE